MAAFHASVFPPESPRPKPLALANLDDIRPVADQIDQQLSREWQQLGVEPAGRAPDLQIARRLSLALTGTAPSLQEIRLFEKQPAGERIDWWLSGIFADRRYSDYLAERLARSYVGVEDGPFLLYRRRRFVAWLADELSRNQPYDEITRHLIADSGVWTDTPPINFITVAIKPDTDQDPDPAKLASRVSRAFLGVRIDCAECHDHPFESWKQQDFHHLAAFFGQTHRGFSGIKDGGGQYKIDNRKTGERDVVDPGVPFLKELLPDEGTRRARLARWITHRENPAYARATANRAWGLLFGRPLVEPIDNIAIDGDRPAVLDLLAADFSAHGYDWQRLLRVIAMTSAFQSDSRSDSDDDASVTPEGQCHWAVFPLTRLRPEQVVGALVQSSSLSTIDYQSHIVVRAARAISQSEFVKRYGDTGSDEFEAHGGTIPQRLLMMNGDQVDDKTKQGLIANAATRIAMLAPDDAKAIETAMLAVLSRRPTDEEASHFASRLAGSSGEERIRRLGDLYWTLLNTTEFSWNH